MAFLQVQGVNIRGISCCVPGNIEPISEYKVMSDEERLRFISSTGIKERRIAKDGITTSDLCFKAGRILLDELNWEKNTIDILIFVSQTPDYILPSTAPILQSRLDLPESCISFDISLGCSGYIYGLSVISSLMAQGKFHRGLLLVGDTITKTCSFEDKSTYPLFGDAGTATCLEFNNQEQIMSFHLSSDGSGYNAIKIEDGGYRNPFDDRSLLYSTFGEQINRRKIDLVLDGMDVFSFGINKAPESVSLLLNEYNINKNDIDFFVFHQANLYMNEMIRKKLNISKEKVEYSLENFGNTSSASIPLTLVSNLRNQISKTKSNLILCGFGVGLSWGSVFLSLDKIVCPEIIEL